MTTHNGNLPDPTDRATLESDRNFTLRIRDRERKLIGKIKEALERIDTGTYGVCESCGEENLGSAAQGKTRDHPVHRVARQKQEQDEKVRASNPIHVAYPSSLHFFCSCSPP